MEVRMRAVPVAVVAAAVLHVVWRFGLATSGGDLAAQDAWAEFARAHPDSAYNLAWYGGLHPVSYSVLSPYVMAQLGVRTTMVLAGTVSAGLLALLLVRCRVVARPLWPALFGTMALTGNAVSGRVTFGLGLMFGLAAVVTVLVWPERPSPGVRRWLPPFLRPVLGVLLAALATASSPVAGLFLGVLAAALWLDRRRLDAYVLGLPPVAVVLLGAWLFPFSGEQPMPWYSMILPICFGLAVAALTPRDWRTLRLAAILYCVGVVAVWAVPSPIGTNMTRLALIFGGVALIAVAANDPENSASPVAMVRAARTSVVAVVLSLGLVTSTIWQVATAARDVVNTRPDEAWTVDVRPLIHQLRARRASLARVEVVPARSHREASALSPYVNLARGWNRQADAERNPIFYTDGLLTRRTYHEWLDRWAVRFVVLSRGTPDQAGVEEAALVSGGDLGYLREVWSDRNWRLYEVRDPTPLADPPAEVVSFDAAELVVRMPEAGAVLVRIPDSPWLSLVDEQGNPLPSPSAATPDEQPVNVHGCLSPREVPVTAGHGTEESTTVDRWTVLHAPGPGTYRLSAPYRLPRGTSCPDDGNTEGNTDANTDGGP